MREGFTMSERWVYKAAQLSLRVRDFIDGESQDRNASQDERAGQSLAKHGPRDGRVLYHLPRGDLDTAQRAVASARQAFEDGRWSGLPVQRRKEMLFKLADLLVTHQ